MKTKYQCTIAKSIEIDSYNEGCLMEGGGDFGIIHTVTESTLEKCIQSAESFCGGKIYIEPEEDFPACIQVTENKDGYEASKKEIESWKENKLTLYLANYSLYFSEVQTIEINSMSIHQAISKMEGKKVS